MIGTRSELMQAVLDTVRQMTPEQKRELREALMASFCRCGQHHTVMGPLGPCECGERKLLVCNRERLHCLRCPVCELSDIFQWLHIGSTPDKPELSLYDRIFLNECGILGYDSANDFNLNAYDIAFLETAGVKTTDA